MKRSLAVLLALMMVLGAMPAVANGAVLKTPISTKSAAVKASAELPEVGDVVNGFELLQTEEFPLIGSQLLFFEHQRTGAKLIYVANDSTNRVFQLTFATRPIDSTGLPHVFEHSTLSGSEKYPSAALFMNLIYQTYNTYMNAYTTDAMTCYPVASLSEAQLLKYADYYTDSCLHPNILADESIFRTEAWRYRMASMDDDLTIEGTVYSEMQGSFTLSRAAMLNANQDAFPGASLGYDYGGDPDYIPDMTWDALKEYHEKFYHPSNCIAYLYGQFDDYAAFLQLLDEAFAPYEKADFHYEATDYARITGPVERKVGFPMAEGTDPTNQSYIYYYIVCPGMKGDAEQEAIIDNLGSLLDSSSSVLMQNLKKAFPAASFAVGRELAAPDDAILFLAANVNEDDAALFKQIVDDSLRQIAETGFPQDMVDSLMANLSMSSKLASESTDPVEGVLYNLAYYYVVTGDPFAYVSSVGKLDRLDEMNQQGLYQTAISQWLLDKELYTLTTTYPEPGQKDVKDAALAERLAGVKAAMSDAEKQAIIDATNAPKADEDASALVAQLQAVTLETLPEEVKVYDVSDETGEDGIRRIDVTAAVDGVGTAQIYLDAQAMPQEDLHYFRLFTRLLGQLDTDKHTKEDLDVLTSRYLYDGTIGISLQYESGDAFHPYLILEWTAMDDDLAVGYDLIKELVFGTQFTDYQKLAEKVEAQKTSVRNTINSNSYSVMLYRGLGVNVPLYRYYSYINHLDYYAFLCDLEVQLQENPEAVAQRFESIQSFFSNNAGAVSAFAGNEASIQLNRPLADAFLAELGHVETEPAVYDLPVAAKREALIIDGNVQFNNVIASLSDLGVDEYTADLDVIASLVQDQYLLPVLRDQYGCYGAWNGIIPDGGFYLITYRDPNIAETFDYYATLPQLLAQADVEQDELEGYILSNYSSLVMGSGELAGAVSAIDSALNGTPQDQALGFMRELKAISVDSLKGAADLYQKALENGVYSTSGSAAAINANADRYDVILNPFNTQDSTQVVLTDVEEGSDYYDAVRFVFESGMMAPIADDAFGVDANATNGDFLAALYAGLGGPTGDPEGARDWLAGYGLVDPDLDVTEDLTEQFLCDILVNGLGVGISTDTPDAIVTRGDLADLLYQLFSE